MPSSVSKRKIGLMKMFVSSLVFAFNLLLASGWAAPNPTARLVGDYLEVRSCEVYTGPCVANSEMNLSGREGLLVWSIRDGSWNGVSLKGLSVIAAVRSDDTLGDVKNNPRRGRAVLIVDAKADSLQEAALKEFVRSRAGELVAEIAAVK